MTTPTSSLVGHVDEITRDFVRGWAADANSPDNVVDVLICINDKEIALIPANILRSDLMTLGRYGGGAHGFEYRYPGSLDATQELFVTVHYAESKDILPNGKTLLRLEKRQPADSGVSATADDRLENRGLIPLLVSSAGRSGSTVLMQILLSNSSVVAGNAYPFEARPGAYFSNVLRVITTPSDGFGADLRDTFDEKTDSIGVNPFNHREFQKIGKDPGFVRSFFENTVHESVGATFRDLITSFYSRLATDQSRPSAIYFAEKCDISRQSRAAIRSLYGNYKELILVRDLRDVMCSFVRFFSNSPAQAIDHLCAIGDVLLRAKREADEKSLIIKYEDVVARRSHVLRTLEDFLGVEREWRQDRDVEADLHHKHGTTSSPESSIGRWKTDMTHDEQESCNSRFAEFLKEFDYA